MKLSGVLLLACAALVCQSCFTGVEGTGKINLSKKDMVALAPKEEDLFLNSISLQPLGDWQQGKRFYVTDERLNLLFSGAPIKLLPGDILTFESEGPYIDADGQQKTSIIFSSKGESFNLKIDRPFEEARSSINSSDIGMMIDADVIEAISKKLVGKDLWTKSALWLDDSLKYKKGKKFNKVTVTQVLPGNTFYPIVVRFKSDAGEEGAYLMALAASSNSGHGFGNLFSFRNPRENYKNISSEVWEIICNEGLRAGMTKEECRISRGNPSDVDMGHNYSNAVEIWSYPDGTFLQFVDGLLVNFK